MILFGIARLVDTDTIAAHRIIPIYATVMRYIHIREVREDGLSTAIVGIDLFLYLLCHSYKYKSLTRKNLALKMFLPNKINIRL